MLHAELTKSRPTNPPRLYEHWKGIPNSWMEEDREVSAFCEWCLSALNKMFGRHMENAGINTPKHSLFSYAKFTYEDLPPAII